MLRRKQHNQPLSFPVDTTSAKEILIILPEQHLNVLHQLRNVISLMTLFKHAGITLLCERTVSAYIKMIPGLNIIEYNAEDHYSSEFFSIARQFRNNTDICFLLDEQPELPILYLIGSTGASIRVGYCDAGDFPFLNLHIRPSPEKIYRPDRFSSMSCMFGAKQGELKWRVAQKTVEEVDHLIKEHKIAPSSPLIAFDAPFFTRQFGTEWTDSFAKELFNLHAGLPYVIVKSDNGESGMSLSTNGNFPVFVDLSVSRMAALVSKTKVVISGNTPLYALAGLLHRPAAGIFRTNEELVMNCPCNDLLKGISCDKTPGQDEINQLIAIIKSFDVND